MKTTFVAVAALASVAYAQLDAIPSCALSCLTSAIGGDGCSGLTDFACHCGKSTLVSQVTPCVQSNCDSQEIQDTVTAVENLCSSAGVPITITVGGGSSSAAATSAAASSAAGSSAAASTPASSAAESTAAASSPAGYSSAAASTGAASTGGSPSTGTNATVTTSNPSQFTGAANSQQVAAGFLGVAMAVAAVAGL